MRLLTSDEIHAIHAAAIAVGHARRRDALLGGVDRLFVDGLTDSSDPSSQLLSDLNQMNDTGALSDGSVPLRVWLANAVRLAGLRREVAEFRRALDQCRQQAPGVVTAETPVVQLPTPRTREELLDALQRLSSSQFEEVLFRLSAPMAHIPTAGQPQTMRAIALLQHLEPQSGGLERLEAVLRKVQTA